MNPTICFGQQPCGFFPKRFLVAKINTARKLQKKTGGTITFFYHDSDADYRETITIMRDRMTGAEVRLNFTQENKLQKKHSPLYLKRIPQGWKEEILKQLPRFLSLPSPLAGEGGRSPGEGGKNLIDLFKSVDATNVADFCLQMYEKLGLLEGIEVIRSSDKVFREKAVNLQEYYADVEYQGEIVRAKIEHPKQQNPQPHPALRPPSPISERGRGEVTRDAVAVLHEGGDKYTKIPLPAKILKQQKSAGSDLRFAWMQSFIHCTHYIYGEGEKEYLKFDDYPKIYPVKSAKGGPAKAFNGVKFIQRDSIDNSNYAWIGYDRRP